LEVKDMRKIYRSGGGWFAKKREVRAADGVSFSLRPGETMGIVGESGSGKSTIGKCLLRLVSVDSGEITVRGRDISRLPERQLRPMRKEIQMIFQDPFSSLNPRHTVRKIITDGPRANGIARQEAIAIATELLDLVGLDQSALNRYPNQFSGGQRQRIGIARALALDLRVIIAGESVSALDVSVQAQVLELLRRIQQRLNIGLIFITHDLRVAAQICDAVAVMQNGVFVEYGAPGRIFDHPQEPYTQRLVAAIPGQERELTAVTSAG